MTDNPHQQRPVENTTEVELTEDQRAYEAMFGIQSEWHQRPSDEAAPEPQTDDDLYRALFGA